MRINVLSKKIISSCLALTVFITAITTAFAFSSYATENLNTKIYSVSDFTEEGMKENFKQWDSKTGFVDYTGNTDTISDGVLSVTGGTAQNTRYSAHFHKTESLNQTVSVSFGMDGSNPAASAVVWLRAGSYYRSSNYKDWVPTGYHVSCSRNGGFSIVTLHKAHENDDGIYAITQIGQVAQSLRSYSDIEKEYLDITIKATATYDEQAKTTVINVLVFKGTVLQYSASFEDNEPELQDKGKVGFAVNNGKNLTVPFKNFEYHTTDNSEVNAFLTENTQIDDGTMVGMYTAIDPTATYKFSAYVDASESAKSSFETEPLCIMYKGASDKGQQLLFTPTTTGVTVDKKYKKYTYTVNLPSGYVTETGTFKGTSNSKTGMTLAFVGYAMKDAAVNGIKYGGFELRQVKSDGSLGGNLLCNSDFKMGMYGWSEDITPDLWQITPQGFDSINSGEYLRATFNYVESKYDYWKNFVPSGFTAGEFNLDGKINICDLVRFSELTDYSIYGDIDKNGVIDVTDENAIKDALLNLQYKLNLGEKKIAEVDTLATEKKKEILSVSSSLENTSGAKVYYVAANGNDSNAGTKSAPWKTINKVNSVIAAKSASDKYVICFNRGDTFRGKLLLRSNVTLTAYGTGTIKPIITVSPENAANSQKWTLVDSTNKIYRYSTKLMDVGSIFFNGGESYAAKRTPDIIKDVGGNYRYSYGYEVLEDMQFICLPDAKSAITLNNDTAADITGYVYLKCNSGNPGAIYDSIEFNTRVYVVNLENGSENITIDNISVKFGGAHGIGGGDISNLLVQNCEVSYIGGGIQQYIEKDNGDGTYTYSPARYGNAVEVNTACDGYTVNNCYIHDIYDTGVTHQTGANHTVNLVFKDVYYTNNLIENCTYSVEWFVIPGTNGATMMMDNIVVSNNIMRNAGSGFGVTRTLQENMWNMSTHIMGWFSHKNQLKEGSQFIISENIFDRSIYSELTSEKRINSTLILVAAGDTAWLPTFSGNTYIHYLDSSFCYYGENVPANLFNAAYLTKHTLTIDLEDSLSDNNAQVFFARR